MVKHLSLSFKVKNYVTPNSSNAEVTFVQNTGMQRQKLSEYSQMSTHVPGFEQFFRFFVSFCIGQISHQQQKGLHILAYEYLQILSSAFTMLFTNII